MRSNQETFSDEGLRQAVLHALAADRQTATCELRVGVLNGIAHLGGSAPSVQVWEHAGEVAAGVAGVRAVANRIEAPGAPSPARTIHVDIQPE